MSFPSRIVERIEVSIPPGPRGEVGFAIAAAGVAIIPINAGAWVVEDNAHLDWQVDGYHDSGSWSVRLYNTGIYAHTVGVRFHLALTGAAATGPSPIDPALLVPVVGDTGGAFALPPPDVTLPPIDGTIGAQPPPDNTPPPLPPPAPLPPDLPLPPPAPLPAPPPSTIPTGGPPVTAQPHIGPRVMYDSVNARSIPASASMVAQYDDIPGSQHTPRPGLTIVHISRNGLGNDGDVLDTNEGVPNEQAPGWARRRRGSGAIPAIYTNAANVGTVRALFTQAGEPQPLWWVAEWTGQSHDYPGAVATQYANPQTSGGNFDLSHVPGAWPGVDPGAQLSSQLPPTQPPIAQGGTADMTNQDVAAVVKLAYDVLAIRKTLEQHGWPPGGFTIDAADPTDFNNQVNAVVQGRATLHDVINSITLAP